MEPRPEAPAATSYVLRTGDAALDRLHTLDALAWPGTSALLDRVGVDPGLAVLDAGCGSGLVTMRLARRGLTAVGIDADAVAIGRARAVAAAEQLDVRFETAAIETYASASLVDVAYTRFLLSHVTDPARALARLVATTRPGGLIVAEDVHFPGHFCAPANASFDRYVELYEAVARARGANASLGVELPTLFRRAGLLDVGFDAHVPTFHGADQLDGLTFAARTLEGIADAVVDAGLASRDEVQDLVAELDAFARQEGTVMSMVRVCQTWGRVPG